MTATGGEDVCDGEGEERVLSDGTRNLSRRSQNSRINHIHLIPDEGFGDNKPDPTERLGS